MICRHALCIEISDDVEYYAHTYTHIYIYIKSIYLNVKTFMSIDNDTAMTPWPYAGSSDVTVTVLSTCSCHNCVIRILLTN